MFSSFAHYLPSALQHTISPPLAETNDPQEPLPRSNFDPSTDDEGDEEDMIAQAGREQERRLDADDDRRRPKSKKEKDQVKMASETLIFVRPPPSKSNHPLNLQVQLVPPNARAPSGITVPTDSEPTTPTSASSVSTMTTDDGRSTTSSVARSASTRSTQSNYSINHPSNSTTSLSSMATDASGASSATSSSSGRNPRRIIPLYNLQAHNVLTNTIVDAGTDAKIAKFQKRGLELIDLAVLEPVEVWGVKHKEAKREGMLISVDEMGTIIRSPAVGKTNFSSSKNPASLLQPTGKRKDNSRPATPSASSSAVSLASNSTQFGSAYNSQGRPQLLVSPPHNHPPASAPPHSSSFPPEQLVLGSNSHNVSSPQATSPPMDLPSRTSKAAASPLSNSTEILSTTPTKKSSASIFGKFKFNTKRQPSPMSPTANGPTSPTNAQQTNDFGQFAMAPLVPGDLNQRVAASAIHVTPATPPRGPLVSPPTSPMSLNSQNSNTPTPTPITPRYAHETGEGDEESPVSPTPTVGPAKFNPAPDSEMNRPGHSKNLSLSGALSRGRNKLIGGMKGSNTLPSAAPEPAPGAQPMGGARALFGKIAAGITGSPNGANGNGTTAQDRNVNGLLSSRSSISNPRASVESNSSTSTGISNIRNKFDRILSHSNSQQFIGNSGGSSHKPSSESLRRQALGQPPPASGIASNVRPLAQTLLHQPIVPPPPLVQPSTSTSQLQNAPAPSQPPQHVTLRQLQLRPPVLGIQPTYVSASNPQPTTYNQQPSTTSLVSSSGQPLVTDENVVNFLREVESRSTFSGETEESVASGSKKRSGSKARDGSARNSLNLERDAPGAASNGSAGGPSVSGKEKALMYVWLVRRWLKKRNLGGPEHGHSASESRAGSLLSNLVGSRDRDRGDRDLGKRGSWHAGAGIGLVPSLGAMNPHSQQPSASSAYAGASPTGSQIQLRQGQRQQFVLGPVIGGGLEVRFEWKRAKAKKEKRGRKKDKGKEKDRRRGEVKVRDMAKEQQEDGGQGVGPVEETPRPPQVGMVGGQIMGSPQRVTEAERKRANRMSTASLSSIPPDVRDSSPSKSSASPSRRATNASSTSSKKRLSLRLRSRAEEEGGDGDDDEESDAEDSETPWVCTLKIRRVAPGGVGVSAGDGSGYLAPVPASGGGSTENVGTVPADKEQTLRLKVGTLSQTPHHPKVVAMLKIPFPLPDVEVERMEVVPRKGMVFGPQAQNDVEQEGEPYRGLTLTAEEIKDVVCSTGLWLAVREGFGGVGKVSRKGDGWKIRG